MIPVVHRVSLFSTERNTAAGVGVPQVDTTQICHSPLSSRLVRKFGSKFFGSLKARVKSPPMLTVHVSCLPFLRLPGHRILVMVKGARIPLASEFEPLAVDLSF